MSGTVRANVYANCRQRGAKRAIMVALTDLLDENGVARFVHSTLADMVAIEDNTIGAYLRALRAEGEIEYTRSSAGPGSMSEVRMPRYDAAEIPGLASTLSGGMDVIPVPPPALSAIKVVSPSTLSAPIPAPPSTHYGYSVHSSQPENPPPTRDVLIPPPVPENQEDSAANAARRQSRPPTAHQAMFGECANVCGFDLALIDDGSKSNLGRLAAAFIAEGVPLGMPTEAWASERRRIIGFADGRAVSPPSVKRLRTLVGAYRKALAEGTAVDLPPGQSIDPVTGGRVVVWENMR